MWDCDAIMKQLILAALLGCCVFSFQAGAHSGFPMDASAVERKLEEIVIESIELKQATLAAAIDVVREAVERHNDVAEDELRPGLRIGYERPLQGEAKKLISLEMEDATLEAVLEEIGKQVDRSLEVHHDGVVLRRPLAPLPIDGLITRQFQVPPDFFLLYYRSEEAVDDPFDPPKPDTRKRRTTRAVLEEQGVDFPEGASAFYHPGRGMLIVRNTADNLELVEAFLGFGPYYPVFLRIHSEIYAVPNQLARDLSRRAGNGQGGNSGLRLIAEAVELGEAALFASPSLVTRSGQRAKVDAGKEVRFVGGVEVVDGVEKLVFEIVRDGLSFEVDPVLGADGITIELNVAMSVPLGEAEFRKQPILLPVSGKVVEPEMPLFNRAQLTTATTMLSDQPQFIGTLSGGMEEDVALVAFITSSVVVNHYELPIPE